MEILAEILLQVLLFFGEILLQVVFELIGELLGRTVSAPFQRKEPVHPALAALGYAAFGAGAGALSLWVFPALFVPAGWMRIANLVLAPIAAGAVMAGIGALRRKKEQRVIRLNSFAYGFLFAFAMALVRFYWGH